MNANIFTKIFRQKRHHPEKECDIVQNAPKREEYERCIMCGVLTNIPVTMPIEQRENYEFGCGQLCPVCYEDIRKTAEDIPWKR